MLNESIWNIFKNTGNIEAILYLNKVKDLNKGDLLTDKLFEKIAVNDQVR
ncbi:hypothetical protein [Serpentinicella alkaliphila]|uniref:YqzL-like protein n=1 Tax=Serpentinicella alkaliphila TaxID=1734049 RepID=A0A4R2UCX6_9FIRM|nr:hypothetical protein [Serpentinicella alkaliphila]QUH26896.1 hypothetical protein HZR23_14970 [Serpentinicella alkaliphila]TCQ08129.1 hypothetical protein EDD79_1001218 [Serpentinicella alkaliphila]